MAKTFFKTLGMFVLACAIAASLAGFWVSFFGAESGQFGSERSWSLATAVVGALYGALAGIVCGFPVALLAGLSRRRQDRGGRRLLKNDALRYGLLILYIHFLTSYIQHWIYSSGEAVNPQRTGWNQLQSAVVVLNILTFYSGLLLTIVGAFRDADT